MFHGTVIVSQPHNVRCEEKAGFHISEDERAETQRCGKILCADLIMPKRTGLHMAKRKKLPR